LVTLLRLSSQIERPVLIRHVRNPLTPCHAQGVNPLEHPGLILFVSFKLFIVGWALFVGFHNKYAGDFGPFITFHDGQVDFGTAAAEWARLHATTPKQ